MGDVQPLGVQEKNVTAGVEKHHCVASLQDFEIYVSFVLFAEDLLKVVFGVHF